MAMFKNLERYHRLINEKDRLERSKLNKIAEFRLEEEFLYRYRRGYFKAQKYVENANELINTKIRKILGYKSSLELFNIELEKLTLCD